MISARGREFTFHPLSLSMQSEPELRLPVFVWNREMAPSPALRRPD
jgi:hypothetical protein